MYLNGIDNTNRKKGICIVKMFANTGVTYFVVSLSNAKYPEKIDLRLNVARIKTLNGLIFALSLCFPMFYA